MVKRSDMFRFLVLWLYGGIYADMDIGARTADIGVLLRQHPHASVVWEPFWAQHSYGMPRQEPRREPPIENGPLANEQLR